MTACIKESPLPQAPAYEFTFGGSGNEVAGGAALLPDGGFLLVGGSQNPASHDYDLYILKIDASGKEVFSHTFGDDSHDEVGWKIVQNLAGEFVVFGTRRPRTGGQSELQLTLLDADLNVRWQTASAINIPNAGLRLYGANFYELAGGGYIAGFGTDQNLVTVRFDDGGRKIDENILLGATAEENGHFFTRLPDSSFVTISNDAIYGSGNIFLRFSSDRFGNYQGQSQVIISSNYRLRINAVCGLESGGLVVSAADQDQSQHVLFQLDSNMVQGNVVIRNGLPYYHDLLPLTDGRFFLVGYDSYGGNFYGGDESFKALMVDSSFSDIRLGNYGGLGIERLRHALPTRDGRVLLLGETDSYGEGGADLYLTFFKE